MKTIKDLFLDELADMYDAERRVVKALPKMAKAATCPDLQTAILSHLKEAEGHVKKLEQIFQSLDEKAKGQTCKDTVGLLEEGDEIEVAFKARRPSTRRCSRPRRKSNIMKWRPMVACTNGPGCWATRKPRVCSKKFSAKRRPRMKSSPSWRMPTATKKLCANPTKRDRRTLPPMPGRQVCDEVSVRSALGAFVQ